MDQAGKHIKNTKNRSPQLRIKSTTEPVVVSDIGLVAVVGKQCATGGNSGGGGCGSSGHAMVEGAVLAAEILTLYPCIANEKPASSASAPAAVRVCSHQEGSGLLYAAIGLRFWLWSGVEALSRKGATIPKQHLALKLPPASCGKLVWGC